jgi:hypothetical protein
MPRLFISVIGMRFLVGTTVSPEAIRDIAVFTAMPAASDQAVYLVDMLDARRLSGSVSQQRGGSI